MIKSLRNLASKLNKPARRRAGSTGAECVQALETRQLLTGNVVAKMSGSGNLSLVGDNLDNHVEVRPVAGGLLIEGFNATTVNGNPTAFFSGPSFVQKNHKVNLKGGNDTFGIDSGVNGSVNVKMGSGADLVAVANMLVGGNTKVNTGSAPGVLPDQVIVDNVGVAGAANIKGGSGNTVVAIVNSAVEKKLTVNLGSGNDYLGIASSAAPAFSFNGGKGTDTFELFPGGGGAVPGKGFEGFL